MAQPVTLLEMRTKAYRLADQEGAVLRFPTAEVDSYINAGIQALHDVMIENRGFPWLGRTYWSVGTITSSGTTPPTISVNDYGNPVVDQFDIRIKIVNVVVNTVTWAYSLNGGTDYTNSPDTFSQLTGEVDLPMGGIGLYVTFPSGTYNTNNVWTVPINPLITKSNLRAYALPANFYRLHKVFVSMSSANESYVEIPELPPNEEGQYRFDTNSAGAPTYFQLRPAQHASGTGISGGVDYLLLYPMPPAGTRVQINYFPTSPVLTGDGDTVNGYNGWDEYPSYYAAYQMATKDEDWDLADRLQQAMGKMEEDISKMVVSRASRAPRIQDVRKGGGRWRTGGWWLRGW